VGGGVEGGEVIGEVGVQQWLVDGAVVVVLLV